MIPGLRRVDDSDLQRLFELCLPIAREIADTVPTTNTLPVGWAQFYDDGTNRRFYYNMEGTMYYVGLTAA